MLPDNINYLNNSASKLTIDNLIKFCSASEREKKTEAVMPAKHVTAAALTCHHNKYKKG